MIAFGPKATEIFLATIMSLGLPSHSHFDTDDFVCLSHAVYHEARAESPMGQIAVAHTILNRVEDSRWPNDICSVVTQYSQFEYIDYESTHVLILSNSIDSKALNQSIRLSVKSAYGLLDDPTDGADHFYAHRSVTPFWAGEGENITIIENHTFLNLSW